MPVYRRPLDFQSEAASAGADERLRGLWLRAVPLPLPSNACVVRVAASAPISADAPCSIPPYASNNASLLQPPVQHQLQPRQPLLLHDKHKYRRPPPPRRPPPKRPPTVQQQGVLLPPPPSQLIACHAGHSAADPVIEGQFQQQDVQEPQLRQEFQQQQCPRERQQQHYVDQALVGLQHPTQQPPPLPPPLSCWPVLPGPLPRPQAWQASCTLEGLAAAAAEAVAKQGTGELSPSVLAQDEEQQVATPAGPADCLPPEQPQPAGDGLEVEAGTQGKLIHGRKPQAGNVMLLRKKELKRRLLQRSISEELVSAFAKPMTREQEAEAAASKARADVAQLQSLFEDSPPLPAPGPTITAIEPGGTEAAAKTPATERPAVAAAEATRLVAAAAAAKGRKLDDAGLLKQKIARAKARMVEASVEMDGVPEALVTANAGALAEQLQQEQRASVLVALEQEQKLAAKEVKAVVVAARMVAVGLSKQDAAAMAAAKVRQEEEARKTPTREERKVDEMLTHQGKDDAEIAASPLPAKKARRGSLREGARKDQEGQKFSFCCQQVLVEKIAGLLPAPASASNAVAVLADPPFERENESGASRCQEELAATVAAAVVAFGVDAGEVLAATSAAATAAAATAAASPLPAAIQPERLFQFGSTKTPCPVTEGLPAAAAVPQSQSGPGLLAEGDQDAQADFDSAHQSRGGSSRSNDGVDPGGAGRSRSSVGGDRRSRDCDAHGNCSVDKGHSWKSNTRDSRSDRRESQSRPSDDGLKEKERREESLRRDPESAEPRQRCIRILPRCKFFGAGTCKNGDRCRFKHVTATGYSRGGFQDSRVVSRRDSCESQEDNRHKKREESVRGSSGSGGRGEDHDSRRRSRDRSEREDRPRYSSGSRTHEGGQGGQGGHSYGGRCGYSDHYVGRNDPREAFGSFGALQAGRSRRAVGGSDTRRHGGSRSPSPRHLSHSRSRSHDGECRSENDGHKRCEKDTGSGSARDDERATPRAPRLRTSDGGGYSSGSERENRPSGCSRRHESVPSGNADAGGGGGEGSTIRQESCDFGAAGMPENGAEAALDPHRMPPLPPAEDATSAAQQEAVSLFPASETALPHAIPAGASVDEAEAESMEWRSALGDGQHLATAAVPTKSLWQPASHSRLTTRWGPSVSFSDSDLGPASPPPPPTPPQDDFINSLRQPPGPGRLMTSWGPSVSFSDSDMGPSSPPLPPLPPREGAVSAAQSGASSAAVSCASTGARFYIGAAAHAGSDAAAPVPAAAGAGAAAAALGWGKNKVKAAQDERDRLAAKLDASRAKEGRLEQELEGLRAACQQHMTNLSLSRRKEVETLSALERSRSKEKQLAAERDEALRRAVAAVKASTERAQTLQEALATVLGQKRKRDSNSDDIMAGPAEA